MEGTRRGVEAGFTLQNHTMRCANMQDDVDVLNAFHQNLPKSEI